MKKLIFSLLAVSAFCSPAFAKNLGQLSEDRQPQNLKPADTFVQYANSHDQAAPTNNSHGDANRSNLHDCDDFLFGMGGLGLSAWDLSLGWGLWPYTYSYFPYYSYYYPYYYGSYYYPYSYGYYGYSYPYYYWSQPSDNQQPRTATRSDNNHQSMVATDRTHTPVVCFAADDHGNWFANVDSAANAVKNQNALNQECSQSGSTCRANLGCALAVSQPDQE